MFCFLKVQIMPLGYRIIFPFYLSIKGFFNAKRYCYKHLKYSNGSKHVLHLYIALQAVDPKWLTTSVSLELQIGHSTFFS
jgi:hypothetical protein